MSRLCPKHSWGIPLVITGVIALTLQGMQTAQAAEGTVLSTPYANNSTIENHLDFLTPASALPPIPSSAGLFLGTGIATNTTQGTATATTGAYTWNLAASGSSMLYAATIPVAGLRADTNTVGGALNFNTDGTGLLGDLVGLSFAPLTWSATTTLNSLAFAAGNYAYEFDFRYLGGVLALNTALSNDFRVRILEGSTVRYDSGAVGGLLPNLLSLNLGGLLLGGSVVDARLPFFYGGTGALSIEFTGTQSNLGGLNATVLDALLDNPLYTISNGDIVAPVPEPGSVILLGVGALLLLRRRRAYAV